METLDLLRAHRSVRKYTDAPIAEELVTTLIEAGQAAASSSFVQATTVIRLQDKDKRLRVQACAANQAYISAAPEFWVFCGDLRRAAQCCAMHQKQAMTGYTEHMIIASVDVALFAQNVVIAAESQGLGICYIGAIRNNPQEVADILDLPDQVFPLFGLCLGYPAHDPEVKPRLPKDVIVKTDGYDDTHDIALIEEYDKTLRQYYQQRTSNKKSDGYSDQLAKMLSKESRPHMLDFLRRRGLLQR